MEQVAQTILNQLGGYSRLNAMVGLKNVIARDNGLSFKIKVRGTKANYVKITLNSLDLYDLEIGKVIGAKKYTVKYTSSNIYFDMLKPIIEEHIGCYLSI